MVSNVEYLRLFHSCDDIVNGDFSRLDSIADEYESLQARVAEMEKDAARYRAILENEWLDPNMQPFALREAAATKTGGMLEAVLDQFIDAA